MIQGGCPDSRGTGGGYKFEDECRDDLRHDTEGVLSMAVQALEPTDRSFLSLSFLLHTSMEDTQCLGKSQTEWTL